MRAHVRRALVPTLLPVEAMTRFTLLECSGCHLRTWVVDAEPAQEAALCLWAAEHAWDEHYVFVCRREVPDVDACELGQEHQG